MNREDWLRYGHDNGYCSPPLCCPHDGIPMTDIEVEEPDECFTVVRIYKDDTQRTQILTDNTWLKVIANNYGWNTTT